MEEVESRVKKTFLLKFSIVFIVDVNETIYFFIRFRSYNNQFLQPVLGTAAAWLIVYFDRL